MNNFSVILSLLLVAYATSECSFKSHWTYRLERIDYNTTNEDAFSSAIRAVYVNREERIKGVNGTVTFGTPLDNKYLVNLKILKSPQRSSQFITTPYGYTDLSFYDFMNNFYKDQLMDELHRCAGQQLFDEMTEPVMPHKVVLNECYFKIDCLISHLDSALYKFILEIKGPAVTFVGVATITVEKTY